MKKPLKSWLIASTMASMLAVPGVSFSNSGVEKLAENPKKLAYLGRQLCRYPF